MDSEEVDWSRVLLLVVAIGGLHLAMPFRAMSAVSMGAIEIKYNAPSDAIPDQSQSTL
jgi:hypothetical protein